VAGGGHLVSVHIEREEREKSDRDRIEEKEKSDHDRIEEKEQTNRDRIKERENTDRDCIRDNQRGENREKSSERTTMFTVRLATLGPR